MKYFLPQYAARAVVDLENAVHWYKETGDKKYALFAYACEEVSRLIRSAVHVVLPANGEVYRSNAIERAAPTQDECDSFAGLPAPVTCFQYPWTHGIEGEHLSGSVQAPKRITLVVDGKQTGDRGNLENNTKPEDAVFATTIYSVYFHEFLRRWVLADISISLAQPLQILRGDKNWGWLGTSRNLVTWAYQESGTTGPSRQLGEMTADLCAVVQCCHSLRAGARLDEATEQSSSRRRKFERLGVGGFTYHVLKLPQSPDRYGVSILGGHGSPRLHVRRAHIRKLSTGSLTFVRQCFVGDPSKGLVEKHYKVM